MKLDNIIAQRNNKVIYRDGNTVIKVFNDDYKKSDILNEALNQSRIEETGLNIPKILEVTKIDGKWAIVSEFIEGKTLAEIMAEDKANIDKYIERFVEIQMDVHAKKSQLLTKIKDKMHGKISASAELIEATTRYELHTRLESLPNHKKVLHGDFNPSNIIITPDDKAYVIDWAHATQGNASADVARTYLLFCLHEGEDFAKKYLEAFCKKSDTALQYIEKWMPIVAASQSVKGNKDETDFLLKWVDIFDFE